MIFVLLCLFPVINIVKACCVFGFSEEWFGMLYSWADNKKKSNLMLSIFEPGVTGFWSCWSKFDFKIDDFSLFYCVNTSNVTLANVLL